MKDSWPMEILDGQSLSKSWLVCPIHRLPTELVLLIFTYATSFVTQTDGLDLDFFDFPVEITVIHISQTCSLWRSISFAVPSLWANIRIAIDVVQHVSQFNSVVGCLDVLLRGSGEAPLTILHTRPRHRRDSRARIIIIINTRLSRRSQKEGPRTRIPQSIRAFRSLVLCNLHREHPIHLRILQSPQRMLPVAPTFRYCFFRALFIPKRR
ncbi:hypothetical protein BT96DRAFT_321848 [Gymnopus androsaceus JB14]|uniref:F-box domain-containing protein n=1 Tax=Gymnopus androsaceus JB14 TaxID=1447944 RepID=A0A6A4GYU1_9AGAR|nr:hypothetical protein BT96DRAFT_321848 [Gymnopus androsaceus JB14]